MVRLLTIALVEHRTKNAENQGLVSYYDRRDAILQLKSVDVQFAISDLLRGRRFGREQVSWYRDLTGKHSC
ncbi:MAG: hypothetical protein AAFY57_14840 [Cyanobacteria bacterium J06642_2]